MRWDIGEFRTLAEARLPMEILAQLRPSLNSIPWKFVLSRYHLAETARILSEPYSAAGKENVADAVGKLLNQAAGTEEGRAFADACFRAEAHMIAFAQALHSVGDLLASILWIVFDLDQFPSFKGRKRYLGSAIKAMERFAVAPSVARAARQLLESEEFRYLSSYVNTTKHHSLVPVGYSVNLVVDDERHGLRIAAFVHGDEAWPERWASDFLEVDSRRLADHLGAVGAELNDELRSLQPNNGLQGTPSCP